ncbi:Serine/threonine-protein kinase MARK2 [Heterocephalus glaber]|uniref:Serine/threonine-protein kinase MARK2 n=1 Tax=Heterocephalus glaber TaxID=10181 RepID=G5AZN0_HETGA|nr:Serine/threonine-protein kinase MARK2 [Heterocephalus glaber]
MPVFTMWDEEETHIAKTWLLGITGKHTFMRVKVAQHILTWNELDEATVYRDLKENLLFNAVKSIKVADFSFSNESTFGDKLDTLCHMLFAAA